MGTRARWVGDSHIFHKYIGTCFLSGRGVIKCLRNLNDHQYGQKFHFYVQFQPRFSKIGILFIWSPGTYWPIREQSLAILV